MNQYPKRLIEVDLPIARISVHARAEKDSRLGHIPRLHIYPAARPVAACRAVICASLWPDPADELCPMAFREAAIEQIKIFAGKAASAFLPSDDRPKLSSELKDLEKGLSDESRCRWEAIANGTLTIDAKQEADWGILRLCLLDFIADFANWDNSMAPAYLEASRALTQVAHKVLDGTSGRRPMVVDPFAGGGAIPLEGLRVGADVISSDQNPLALLIQKVLLEYTPEFGERLSQVVDDWYRWVQPRAMECLSVIYPNDSDGRIPIAYLWARTILSEAPEAGKPPVEVPLIRSMWLTRKRKVNSALRWVRDQAGNVQTFTTKVAYANGTEIEVRRPLIEVFEPSSAKEVEKGTAARNSATCPVTGYTTSAARVQEQLKSRQGGADDARMYCVVTMPREGTGRCFRVPGVADEQAVNRSRRMLKDITSSSAEELSLIPSEPLPIMSGVFNAPLYGHSTWGTLFTSRQALYLAKYTKLTREFLATLNEQDVSLAKAASAVLGLVIDRLADLNASLCVWQLNTPNTAHVFGRWALPMVMDFGEINPLAGAGGSPHSAIKRIQASIRDTARGISHSAHVQMASADEEWLPSDCCDLLFTDPPYYNAIPYADISDFFYIWLRRTIGEYHPQLFATDTTPKDREICEMAGWDPIRYPHKDKEFFEDKMTLAMREARKYLKPSSLGVVVFAHKSTSGWEAMLQAMIDASFVITASWPIDTEMGSRLRAKNSAVLGSSVHIICRPRENPDGSLREEIGEWRDVLSELPKRIHEWMPRLAAEGVVGADAIFACLGPALEIFSRYSRVEKASGEAVPLREYLEHVWAAISTEALSMIFHDADAAGLEPDGRLTAMWLWTLGAGAGESNGQASEDKVVASTGYTLEFDAARKIAQGLGIHLEQSESIVEVRGDRARLLPVSERTKYLFGKDSDAPSSGARRKKKSKQKTLFEELDDAEAAEAGWGDVQGPSLGETVLDRVHQSMILFAAGRSEAMKRFLVEDGAGTDARFWKLAQSLSALYLGGTDEKRWVDGVLARKKGLGL